MENKKIIPLLVLLGGILGGTILLVVGIILTKDAIRKAKKCTLRVTAKVKDLVKVEFSDDCMETYHTNYYSWYPIFEYTIEGQTIISKSSNGMAKPKYIIGQKVELCCNPEDYNEYYVLKDTMQKKIGIILGMVGVIWLGISSIFLKFVI